MHKRKQDGEIMAGIYVIKTLCNQNWYPHLHTCLHARTCIHDKSQKVKVYIGYSYIHFSIVKQTGW